VQLLLLFPFLFLQGKMRNRLIKKAKTNGDELGFLW
jgi:hypothetical protein